MFIGQFFARSNEKADLSPWDYYKGHEELNGSRFRALHDSSWRHYKATFKAH